MLLVHNTASARRLTAAGVLTLWLVALFLLAAWFTPIDSASTVAPFAKPGLTFLMIGPIGLFDWQPAWLANLLIPALGVSLALRDCTPLWAAIATTILPLFALFELGVRFDFDNGANSLSSFGIGYWLWCLAAALPLIVRLTIDRPTEDEI